ncbi:MAG: AI-2E family transporter [Eubacterium sp.]|nr:AI-2E family transporter [Candidatus Colimonas fimequi]
MKIKLDENNIKWGTTAFLVVVASMMVLFAMLRLREITGFIDTVVGIFSPFIWGFVIAYLLCPIYNGCVRATYAQFNKSEHVYKKSLMISKVVGTLVSLAVLFCVIIGIIWMILPGFMESVTNIVDILPSGTAAILTWVESKLAHFPIAEEQISRLINSGTDNILKFITETFLPNYGNIAESIQSGIMGAVNLVKNFFIGVIISVYFLNSKDVFSAQAKKAIFATMKERTANSLLELAQFTNKSFGGFISGKIIDSAIIGILCFVFMNIVGWEYALLISCIIGITNIIPFFGPFIGMIPSAMLLVLVNPMHALYFLIFILVLQQFDGNVLGPKILGDTTGLGSFWVLFAVLVGGGLFGFIGMIVSIPIFAVIYFYGAKYINYRLEKRGFSTAIADYRIDSYRTPERPDSEVSGITKMYRKVKKKRNKNKTDEEDE